MIEGLQKESDINNIKQDVLIDTTVFTKAVNESYLQCLRDHKDMKPKDILDLCNPIVKDLSVNNISIKNMVNISSIAKQGSAIQNENTTDIVEKMKSKLQQENSAISIGTSASSLIDSLINLTQKNIISIIQEINNGNYIYVDSNTGGLNIENYEMTSLKIQESGIQYYYIVGW